MDVNKKKKVKFVNEDSDTSEEDVNEYKEEYNTFYHCAHCNYKKKFPNCVRMLSKLQVIQVFLQQIIRERFEPHATPVRIGRESVIKARIIGKYFEFGMKYLSHNISFILF